MSTQVTITYPRELTAEEASAITEDVIGESLKRIFMLGMKEVMSFQSGDSKDLILAKHYLRVLQGQRDLLRPIAVGFFDASMDKEGYEFPEDWFQDNIDLLEKVISESEES